MSFTGVSVSMAAHSESEPESEPDFVGSLGGMLGIGKQIWNFTNSNCNAGWGPFHPIRLVCFADFTICSLWHRLVPGAL